MKRLLLILFIFGQALVSIAQNIPVPLTQTKLYDFLDELLTDGVLVHQTAVRPYSRQQVATMLLEAQAADSLLNNRQQKDLAFYLNEFALGAGTGHHGSQPQEEASGSTHLIVTFHNQYTRRPGAKRAGAKPKERNRNEEIITHQRLYPHLSGAGPVRAGIRHRQRLWR